ncbi:MAG TPA: alpha/beta family hydrolase [Acidimicrobiales bacterium]|jgi:predicted alpha/beta-hydrolase family hydrolase|nr:alpha/beta family hydrolase [Acidimicrobiales bacterium]
MSVDGLLLAHGAGGGADHHVFLALEAALAPLPVHRMEFPYRREGRKAPDRAPKLIASVVAEAEAFAARIGSSPERLVLGGRSMGGRMCSMAVAEGLPAAGLALLSYPLHPPGKADRMRVDHFADLHVPCLFVAGDRDPFGSPDEIDDHVAAIVGPVTTVWLAGQRHDPKAVTDPVVVDAVSAWLATIA